MHVVKSWLGPSLRVAGGITQGSAASSRCFKQHKAGGTMQPMILANSTEFLSIKLAHANKVLVNRKQLKVKDIVPQGLVS